MKSIHPSTAKKIANLPAPKSPLKGRDHARKNFDFGLNNPLAKQLWNLIPSSHKDEVGHRRTGGYFGFTKVISPEAAKASQKVLAAISADLTAKSASREIKKQVSADKALLKERTRWLALPKFPTENLWDRRSTITVSEDGQTMIFTRRNDEVARITWEEAKTAITVSPTRWPLDAIKNAAFGLRASAVREGRHPFTLNLLKLEETELTGEEIQELIRLTQGQNHPFTGRALELKQKSGLTWNQISLP